MALWRNGRRSRRLSLICAVGALVLAGCGHASSLTVGAASSATTAAPPHLVWQSASPPEGEPTPMVYAPAPSDGRVTYACGVGPSGARVWSTRDRGANWSGGVTLPYVGVLSSCALTVDANDPQRLVAALNTAKLGASLGATDLVAYISQDGGATWRQLPRIGPHGVMSLTSFDGAIYASGFGLSASATEARDVWVSRDGGRSWQALGATSLGPNPLIWLNPQTGALLGTNNFDLVPTLWRSANAGSTWTRIPVPNVVGAGSAQAFVVAPNGAGWRICATGQTSPGPQSKNALACSDDLGQTWIHMPALNPSQVSPKGFTFIAPTDVFAITDDGALLASYDDVTAGIQLALLAPGASVWTPLGAPQAATGADATGTPAGVVSAYAGPPLYTTGPGGGVLWVNSGDSSRPFSTAAYP